MKISGENPDMLITYALGSCLGITVYDFKLKKAGLLHSMLPDSSIDRNKAVGNPYMYVDSGMKALLDNFYKTVPVKITLLSGRPEDPAQK